MTELPIDQPQESEFQPAPQRPQRGRPRNGTREPTREPTRNGEWIGRDGEVLSRKRTNVADPFAIPESLKDPDWDYQWNSVTVNGDHEVTIPIENMMYDNGWRPVPADRAGFAGRFGKPKSGNAIIMGGLRLDERPKGMSEAARANDFSRARGQLQDRDSALMGNKANLRNSLQSSGMEMSSRYRGTGGDIRMSIDPALDAPRPVYQPPED